MSKLLRYWAHEIIAVDCHSFEAKIVLEIVKKGNDSIWTGVNLYVRETTLWRSVKKYLCQQNHLRQIYILLSSRVVCCTSGSTAGIPAGTQRRKDVGWTL